MQRQNAGSIPFIVIIIIIIILLFGAASAAYGSSQTRGQIGATAASLATATATQDPMHLRPTPQLTATSDP